MSVWSNMSGTTTHNFSDHVSVKSLLEQAFDDERSITCSSERRGDRVHTSFQVTFCDEGIYAAQKVEAFRKAFLAASTNPRVDIVAEIRWD
jgi:hypothetical protein